MFMLLDIRLNNDKIYEASPSVSWQVSYLTNANGIILGGGGYLLYRFQKYPIYLNTPYKV